MSLFRFASLTVTFLLYGTADGARWTKTTPQVQYGCQGHNITIWWRFVLSSTEEVADIRWYFKGRSQELIAVWADGKFLPLPAYHARVEEFDNAGLILNNVLNADSGNYSVVISIHDDSDTFSTLEQSVAVQIGDTLMTQDGQLHVSQKPEAVLDTTTNQWAIELQCGTFTYLADPPFQVEWTIPSSVQVQVSSNYSDNHFNLLLPGPVTGGDYTCRIPPRDAVEACLRPNETDKAQGSLYVGKVLARLLLLESENKQLKEELRQATCPTVPVTSPPSTTTSTSYTQSANTTSTTTSTSYTQSASTSQRPSTYLPQPTSPILASSTPPTPANSTTGYTFNTT